MIVKKPSGKSEGTSSFDFKQTILSESNRLSLYLRLKEIYFESYSGMSKEYEEIFNYKVLSDRKNLKAIQALVSR